jgi:AraC-like DNA-binding protein
MHKTVSLEIIWAARKHRPILREYPFRRFGHMGVWQFSGGPYIFQIEGGRPLKTPDGGLYVIGQWQPFKVSLPTGAVEVAQRGVDFRCGVLGGLDLSRLIHLPLYITPERAEPFLRLTDRLSDLLEVRHDKTLREIIEINQVGFALVGLICDHCRWREEVKDIVREAERLRPAIDWMEQNLERPLKRKDIAARVHLSEPRFSHLFGEVFGVAPMAYFRNLRIEHAGRLLVSTADCLEQIARRVGFHDAFHFSRTFKALTGESPSVYRARNESAFR